MAKRIGKNEPLRTFKAPPRKFNALSASKTDLRRYGLPLRPAALSPARKLWDDSFSRVRRIIKPRFGPPVGKGAQFAWPNPKNPPEDPTQANPTAGMIVYTAPGESIQWIASSWTVCNARSPTADFEGTTPTVDQFFTTGQFSNDNLVAIQVGTCCQTLWQWTGAGYASTTTAFAYYAGADGVIQPVDYFECAPGDVVKAVICILSNYRVQIQFLNVNSGLMTSAFQTDAPLSDVETYTAAFWGIKVPGVPGGAVLPDFGEMFFDSALAETIQGSFLTGGSGTPWKMTDANGNVLAHPEMLTPQAFKVLKD